MASKRFSVGELLVIETLDRRSALLWSLLESKDEYQDVVDHLQFGETVVCIDSLLDSNYLKVMSTRGVAGYIHADHISKID